MTKEIKREMLQVCIKRYYSKTHTVEPGQVVIKRSIYNPVNGFFSPYYCDYLSPQVVLCRPTSENRKLHFRSLTNYEWVCTCCGKVKNTNADTIITKTGKEICVDCDLGFHGAKTWLQQIKKILRPEGFSNVILENGGKC